jgi:hypothetical protein
MRSGASGLRLAVFSFIGLLAGLWVAMAPWVIGFPEPPRGSWSAADVSCVIVGAVVIAASTACLIAAATSAIGELQGARQGIASQAGASRPGQRG